MNYIPAYRNWGTYVLNDYQNYIDNNVSKYTEYKTNTQDIEVQFRRVRDNYNFNVGVLVQPQNTDFVQKYLNVRTDTTRQVLNITPTVDFRYYFSKEHQIRFNYRGNTSQPSMEQLVQITDNTDPMNITIGNPGLKPSFTNNFSLDYNNFISNHFQVISANGGFSTTKNRTVRSVFYDSKTGAQTSTYANVNGNWNANIEGEYSIALDTLAMWNLSNHAGYSYQNNVGLASAAMNSTPERNITRVHNINDRFAGSFRNEWLNVELDGSVTYTKSNNLLQSKSNLNTWAFSYGSNLSLTLPWKMTLSSDIHMRSRRGYSDKSLNTNELIWNAQLSQNFLKAKNLSVILQFYDILKNQSNLSRTINEMSRTDNEFNAINSYAMLHVVYRFNLMGGSDMRDRMGPRGDRGGRPDFNRSEFRDRGNRGGGFRPESGGGF